MKLLAVRPLIICDQNDQNGLSLVHCGGELGQRIRGNIRKRKGGRYKYIYDGCLDEGLNEESMYDGAYYEEEVIGATQVP